MRRMEPHDVSTCRLSRRRRRARPDGRQPVHGPERSNLCREVRGVARRTQTVLDAFFAGAVDLATNDLQTGVLGADIVILATPVRTIVATLREIGPTLWPGTARHGHGQHQGRHLRRHGYVCPPASSPSAAIPCAARRRPALRPPSAGLYRNATWVLSPLPRTDTASARPGRRTGRGRRRPAGRARAGAP